MNQPIVYWTRFGSGEEQWTLFATDKGICRLMYPHDNPEDATEWINRHMPGAQLQENREIFEEYGVIRLLENYFRGKPVSFETVPLDMRGTSFQKEVWTALAQIPYGTTCTYRDIAVSIGRPQAVRAVGAANGANPVPVIVPCHRVVGSNKTLVGYRGGLKIKSMLLGLEGVKPLEPAGHARFQF
ncbi:methylated-DNA--[protein]-cysteine S-methyltransferase [Paenibacillus thermotolerans]|uniref:methylated-DNA--[protein]-cysteine S-methyltransferase n=1 Tax=Paenibacillus thermotolerans TaxID=3027807 RepID=UPI0023687175|nr:MULTISPECIES: methylated-DNA--[protein]-cysteine S-methyltransferase [unclassified Paenibacillus]